MLLLRKSILQLMQTPPEAFAEGERYLSVTLTGIIFIFAYNALSAILRGMGNSKQPFYFITIACVVNVILSFIFVAGLKWGAFGAAFTTVVSQALSVFLCIRYMKKNNFPFDFKFSSFKIYTEQLKLILKIGLPTGIQNSVIGLSFACVTAMVNTVGGVTASAGVGAAERFNSFAFMPIVAMSASISAVAAHNLGAGRLDRAVSACKIGTLFSVVVAFSFFALVMIFPAQILRIFGSDPLMISDGVLYLRSFGWDFLLVPFIFCINGFLIAGGHTFFTFINTVLSSILLRVPVSYFLGITMGWGLKGIGLGVPVASLGALLVIIGYLISGKWKRNVIKHVHIELNEKT
jgi:putative MATE family efflux protein